MSIKKILLTMFFCLILTTFAISSKPDSILNKENNRDTTIIKLAENGELKIVEQSSDNFGTFILQILPFMVALAGIGISAYAIYNQRKVTQSQINVESKRKYIEELKDSYKNINKCLITIFRVSEELGFISSGFPEIKERANNPTEPLEKWKDDIIKEIQKMKSGRNETKLKLLENEKEFYYWTSSLNLFLPQIHIKYKMVKDFSENADKYLSNYILYKIKEIITEETRKELNNFKINNNLREISDEDLLFDILNEETIQLLDMLKELISEAEESLENSIK